MDNKKMRFITIKKSIQSQAQELEDEYSWTFEPETLSPSKGQLTERDEIYRDETSGSRCRVKVDE